MQMTYAYAAQPPARTIISGQAQVSYNSLTNELIAFPSNIAWFPIKSVIDVSIDSDKTKPVLPSSTSTISHIVTNRGNDSVTLNFGSGQSASSDFQLNRSVLYRDVNNNGVLDGLDQRIDGPLILGPEEILAILLEADVPGSTIAGTPAVTGDALAVDIQLTDANTNEILARATDTFEVDRDAIFFASSRQAVGCGIDIEQDDTISFDINLQNQGFNSPVERNYLIDSAAVSGVLIHMPIPVATQLNSIRNNGLGQPIVLVSGSSDWISSSNWNGSDSLTAAGMLVAATDLSPASSHSFGFDLLVTDQNNLPQSTLLEARFDANGDQLEETITTFDCTDTDPSPAGPPPSVRFITPVDQSASQVQWDEIAAFTDASLQTLSEEPGYGLLIDGVYVELQAEALNQDENIQEQVSVTVRSQRTGEQLTLVLYETGIDSALFRSVAAIEIGTIGEMSGAFCPTTITLPPTYNNVSQPGCFLPSALADTLTTQLVDPGNGVNVTDTVPVRNQYSVGQNLTGLVFDSLSGDPLGNATVAAYRGNLAVAQVQTNAQGEYLFDDLPAGDYSIQLVTLTGYEFPSEIDPSGIFEGFETTDASWGLNGFLDRDPGLGLITLGLTGEPVTINIPLDRSAAGDRLVVEKSASVTEAEIGDRVKYTVQVKNVGEQIITDMEVIDTLPFGFKYEPGTARIDGEKVSVSRVTPSLILNVDELASDESIEVTYIAKLTAGAVDSDGVNRVYARNRETQSGVANARVRLSQRGLLSDRAIIFGKLFIDNGCDYVQNDKEWPVPGVRLYFEDGTYVITDENGQYSLYGVKPGLHVVKIDKTTLPEHLTPYPYETRFAADPYSRFADVAPGDFHRADFIFTCPAAKHRQQLYDQLRKRNESINSDWLLEEAVQFRSSAAGGGSFSPTEQISSDGDLSSGTIGGKAAIETQFNPIATEELVAKPMPEAKAVAETLTKADGRKGKWLWPDSDITLDGKLMFAVRSGIDPDLYVNGEKIDKALLGEKAVFDRESLQVQAWYRLPFHQGDNTVVVKALDPFGNMRTLLKERILYQPGVGTKIDITAEKDTLDADRGRSALAITVDITDEQGRPARGLEFVTVESTAGIFAEEDVQDEVPGHQVRVVNGKGKVHLRSSTYTGDVEVAARWQKEVSKLGVRFAEPMRPMVAVGFIDISAQASFLNGGNVTPAQQEDGFDKTFSASGQTSFFLKGKVKGDMLLTMSYNNKKSSDTELFRDIDPNAYYPIYGDASIKGYDAQSRSKLFVKLEKSKHSVLWGDFRTDNEPELNNSLGRINESLTGASGVYDDDTFKVTGYAAEVGRLQQTIELRGNGTATFYRLPNSPILPNSENIEIIVRDRDNLGLVISQTPLVRFSDYTLDNYSGHLRFFEPINFEDQNGNPIFIRVEYQSEERVDEHIVAGVRATVDIDAQWQVGAGYSHNGDETQGYDIATTHVKYELGEKHLVTAEIATMEHSDKAIDGGNAAMIELRNDWDDSVTSRVVIARADEGFNNPSAGISEGRQEVKADVDYRIRQGTDLKFDVIQSEDIVADSSRFAAGVDLRQTIGEWAITGGTRYIQQDNTADDAGFQTGRFRVERGYDLFGKNGSVYAEIEQDLTNTDRRQWAIGTDYQIHDHVTAYIRHETIDSFSGVTSLSTGEKRSDTQIGVRSDVLPNTDLYTETRLRGGIDGEELNAVNGVRSRLEIEKDFNITPSVEIVNVFKGGREGEGWSASLGLTDYRHKNDKRAMRVETRQTDKNKYYAFDGTYAARLTEEWTSLYMNNFYLDERVKQENILSNVMTLGAAVRPRVTNVWNALFFYQFKFEENIAEDLRRAHILSTHHNVLFDYDFNFAARYAMKIQDQTIDNQSFNSQVYLVGGRLIKAIDWRWDIDFRIGVLSSDFDEDLRYSLGIGANYLVAKNLRAGLSYNFVGFQEKDLDSQEYHAQGIRFGLQFKFDEELFKWLQ
ncbi:Uncharacterised protein [BD1-7 clade bacterium]|uniref:DUF11 domain-containing protein n=1 Tax=BD1-7 clade bacterium TaxID=2029982 RepID=A0A5S9PSH4_9GAMM|nr:Uncharacterised protein [BD1-7 clade bacterium]